MKKRKDGTGLAYVSADTRAVAEGEISDLSPWSDAELLRGRRLTRSGNSGRRPKLLPAPVVRELTEHRFSRGFVLLADSLEDGAKMLRAIINDENAAPSDRIRAYELALSCIAP